MQPFKSQPFGYGRARTRVPPEALGRHRRRTAGQAVEPMTPWTPDSDEPERRHDSDHWHLDHGQAVQWRRRLARRARALAPGPPTGGRAA